MLFAEKIKRDALVKRKIALIGISLAGLISSFSHADDVYATYEVLTSKELANKSILAMESFSCSIWADLMGDKEASDTFLMNGYDHGKIYVEGLLNKKIQYDDKRRYIPGIMYPELKFTPNVDFMLGAIFQKVSDNTKAITYDFDAKGSDKYFSKSKESYAKNGCAKILLEMK
ncbi:MULTISPECIES: hypothetical protein [Acinetobacter]|uniref:hypothetical protein n=1 Tax=Acinetobacter TaxID=469 RepID=UPI00124FA1A2|nr:MULTISPECIES: hypothetical protein [Acinetobacter]MDH1005809.1 hypothetical protein [Acinetobacter junii]MDI9719933.1 hypothetical protein [Acinetobacter junii]NAR78153.1 hypothetical protein [Acinetobacter haemolyticus]